MNAHAVTLSETDRLQSLVRPFTTTPRAHSKVATEASV